MQATAPAWVRKTAKKTDSTSQVVLMAYYLIRLALLLPVLVIVTLGRSLMCLAIALRNRFFRSPSRI